MSLEYLVGSIYAVSVNNQETVAVRDWNRRNSVFETELRLTFSPIFRNDAHGARRKPGHHPVDHGLYI